MTESDKSNIPLWAFLYAKDDNKFYLLPNNPNERLKEVTLTQPGQPDQPEEKPVTGWWSCQII